MKKILILIIIVLIALIVAVGIYYKSRASNVSLSGEDGLFCECPVSVGTKGPVSKNGTYYLVSEITDDNCPDAPVCTDEKCYYNLEAYDSKGKRIPAADSGWLSNCRSV
ncbi:MAG: hypothetical protein AABX96_05080 [Nanoarchaeota archaeon]